MNIIANEIGTEVSRWWRLTWHPWLFHRSCSTSRARLLYHSHKLQVCFRSKVPWGYCPRQPQSAGGILNSREIQQWKFRAL